MTVLSLPASLIPVRQRWQEERQDIEFRSVFGSQILQPVPPVWATELEFDDRADWLAGDIKALWMQLAGGNQLEVYDAARPAPLGTYRGTLSLATDVAQGATSMQLVRSNNNLLTNPEALNLSPWGTSAVTVSSEAIAAPDGVVSADKIVETTATAEHYIQQTAPVPTANAQYTFSAFGKVAERSAFGLRAVFSNGASDTNIWFNLATGAAPSATGICVAGSPRLTVDANGFFRASWKAQMPASIPAFPLLLRAHLTNAVPAGSYTGTVGAGLFLWGVKWEAGDLTDYGHNQTLLAGDLLGIGSGTKQQVVMVTQDAVSTGQGNITVNFEHPLRNAFSAGQAVTWDKPKALFRLRNNRPGWDYERSRAKNLKFDLVESVYP